MLVVPPGGNNYSSTTPAASSAKGGVGQSAEGHEAREVQMEDGRVFRGQRCSEAILEFLRTTDVGRKVPMEEATEAESSESGTVQECPQGACVCGLCGC